MVVVRVSAARHLVLEGMKDLAALKAPGPALSNRAGRGHFVRSAIMSEREVYSPINSKSTPKTFGPGSNQPYSPGAFSNPSRGDGGRRDSIPPRHVRVSRNAEEPAELRVTGPEQ
jgi:hypothetical protein